MSFHLSHAEEDRLYRWFVARLVQELQLSIEPVAGQPNMRRATIQIGPDTCLSVSDFSVDCPTPLKPSRFK